MLTQAEKEEQMPNKLFLLAFGEKLMKNDRR